MPVSAHRPCFPVLRCDSVHKEFMHKRVIDGRVGQNMDKLTDRQTHDLRAAAGPRTASSFISFSLSPIFQSTHWSHLVQLLLGVAQWQAKGNQNQMGLRLGPSAEAAVGPSRSWLPSRGCPGRKAGEAWSTARLTAAQPATSSIGRGTVGRHKPRSLTCSEGFIGGWRGQLCVCYCF